MSGNILSLRPRADTITAQFGPIFLGLVTNYFLWGIQFVQSYYYYRSYRKTDRTWLKSAVALLFVADAAQTISCTQGAWKILVAGWGDIDKVNHMGWGLLMVPFTDSFTASIVHGFYGQKIWTLLDSPHNYFWTVVIFFLSCAQLVAGVGGSVFGIAIHMKFSTFDRFTNWATIWFVSAAATDIIIAVLMSWKLSRSRTGYKETNEIISKVLRLTIETGLATSIIQILCVIIQRIFPVKSYVIFPGEITSKLYSNSMLALLNSRRSGNARAAWRSRIFKDGESIRFDAVAAVTATEVVVSHEYHVESDVGNSVKTSSPRDKPRDSLDPTSTEASSST